MDEEIKAGYYAIIPAFIRYNNELRPAEKLLYGEITALSNREGYCFAQNRYFAELYEVSPSTVSRWISHLAELGSIQIELIRNEKKEIIERRIYVVDTPYMQKSQYPYTQKDQYPYAQKSQYPIRKKVKDNNININKIDRFFGYVVDKNSEFPSEFSKVDFNEIDRLLKKYEMIYSKDSLQYIRGENLEKIKYIVYAIALMARDKLGYLAPKVSRDKLIKIYNDCKLREEEYKGEGSSNEPIQSFMNYYYKSIVNELTRGRETPSFFIPKNEDKLEDEEEEL